MVLRGKGGAHKVIGNVFNIEYTEPKPPNYWGST